MAQINLTKYSEIGRRIREIPLDEHIISHEWEELVQKLYTSDDAGLREIGARERLNLLDNRRQQGGE